MTKEFALFNALLAEAGDLKAIAVWFEVGMAVCFGIAWPVAIAKTLRAKRVEGKSIYFLYLVFCGYISVVVARLLVWNVAIFFYVVNGLMVGVEILLYYRYNTRAGKPVPVPEPSEETVSPWSE